MLVVMVRIPVGSREESERMVERFRNRAGLVDGMPGFLGFELLQGDGELISLTRWASQDDLNNWMNSQANAQAHARVPRPTGGGPPEAGPHAHGTQEQTQSTGGQAQPTPGGHSGPQGSVMVYEVVLPAGAGR
ncbi:MAG TPA: antibiotic biosynthesis monooxygenase [Chloroflexia bacterium]|nr:antibiotic biosynthesis monooxygenase [Chloroflexia bacterium]